MKKILSVLLCVAMMLGCVSGVALADDKVTLTWFIHFAEEGMQSWCQKIADEFNAMYGDECEVVVEMIGASDYTRMLQTKIGSEDAPAIFDLMNGRTELRQYTEAERVAVLDDMACLENVSDIMLEQGKIDGVQMGVPIDQCGYGCFYNTAIFEELNLEVPTTWDEFLTCLQTIEEAGYTAISSAYGESWCITCAANPFIYQTIDVANNPNWWTDKMNLTSTFSEDEAFKDGMKKFMIATLDYCEDDPYGTSANDSYYKLANGEAAIVINGSWVFDGCNSLNPDTNIGVFAVPVSNEAEPQLYMAPGNILCMYNFEDEKTREYATLLYDYIYSKDSGTYYAQIARRMTCVEGVDLSEYPTLDYMLNYDATFTTIGMDTFDSEHSTAFLEIQSAAMMEYLEGGDLDEIVDNMCAEMDASFASIG